MIRPTLLLATMLSAAALGGATLLAAAQAPHPGQAVYDSACAACHGSGVLGAPKPGDTAAWATRAKARQGLDGLLKSAIAGTDKGMPPRGGRADLDDAALRQAIAFMAGAAVDGAAPATAAAPAPAPAATPAVTAAAPPPAPATVTPVVAPATPRGATVNAFNRLLKPQGNIHRPAAESGIHDPTNPQTLQLQPPADAMGALPRSMAGNHVDWVKALDGKAIAPRWDRNDPAAAAVVMDLNIVREVKGSMPDVVYPHKQHTEWLDCSNCHPAIFVPQKGANQISMASILLGQKCGVCHGKVAFPVSECRRCHSRKKTEATTAEAPPVSRGIGGAAMTAQAALLALLTLGVADAPAQDDRQQLEQRIRLTASLLADSPAAQRIRASGNPQAAAHLDDGRVHHALSEDALRRGDLTAAREAADEALRHLAMARRLVPDALARQAAARQRAQQMLGHLERLLDNWASRQPPGDGADDGDRMAALGLIETARQFAAAGRHDDAVHVLRAAEGHVMSGLDRLLQAHSREVDYTQRASTPAQAFEIELRRHDGLADLVPQALSQLQPAPDARALVQRYMETSHGLRAQASRLADAGDPDQALARLRDASLYLQRALGAAGVVTPMAAGGAP